MPIPLPNLDDRSYAELTAEAKALIPNIQPEWTDHNPSDPGMVLVELLAWLTEMLLFQVNEIPDASTEGFLRLLNGQHWQRAEGTSLDDAIVATISGLRERYRAATLDDIEHLVLYAWPASDAAKALGDAARVARVRAVPRRNLAATDPAVRAEPAPADISVVVMPQLAAGETHPQLTAELLGGLADFLAPRRTLTTRLRVVGPTYVDVRVTASVALHEDAPPAEALLDVRRALAALFDPLTGGPQRAGWPFGRDVHASEIYAALEQVPLVNYVDDVQIGGPVVLDAHELVRLAAADLTAYDVNGRPVAHETGAP